MSTLKAALLVLCLGTVITAYQIPRRVSVFQFGCAGDGKTDDRPCIQKAADSLSRNGGGTLVFPAKHVFLIRSQTMPGYLINWPANVSMDGEATIKVADRMGPYHAVIHAKKPEQISFRGVTFDGNAENNPVNAEPGSANEHISIQVWAGKHISVENVRFVNGNDVQTVSLNPCDSCSVKNNHWNNYGIGGTFDHDSSEIYIVGNEGLVEGNTFDAAGIGVRTAIEVHRDNMQVLNNIVRGYRIGVVASAAEAVAKNLLVKGNSISDAYVGMVIWSEDGAWDGIEILHNRISIRRKSYWKESRDESGIELYPRNRFPISRLTIADNEIRFAPDSLPLNSYSAGISLVTPNKEVSISDVLVRNNTVQKSLGPGIKWSVAGRSSNVVIDRNTIIDAGSSMNASYPAAYRTGILEISNATISRSSISSNTVTDDQITPTMQCGIYHYGVPGDDAGNSLSVSGNIVSYHSAPTDPQRYFIFRNTAPRFLVQIPNFDPRRPIVVGLKDEHSVPAESVIEDPVKGRRYRATELLKARR